MAKLESTFISLYVCSENKKPNKAHRKLQRKDVCMQAIQTTSNYQTICNHGQRRKKNNSKTTGAKKNKQEQMNLKLSLKE